MLRSPHPLNDNHVTHTFFSFDTQTAALDAFPSWPFLWPYFAPSVTCFAAPSPLFVAFVMPVLHQHQRGHIIKLPTANALMFGDNDDDYYYNDDEVDVGVPPAPRLYEQQQQRSKHLNGRVGNLVSPRANEAYADDVAAVADAVGDGNVAVGISTSDAMVAVAEGTARNAHPLGLPVRWRPAPMQSYRVRADAYANSEAATATANAHPEQRQQQQQQQDQQSVNDDQQVNRTDDAHNLDVDDDTVDGGTDVIGDGINASGIRVGMDAEFTQYEDGSRAGAASTLTGFDGSDINDAGNVIISTDAAVAVPSPHALQPSLLPSTLPSSSSVVGRSMTDGLLLAALKARGTVSSAVLDSSATNGFSTQAYGIDVQTGDNESVDVGGDADADAEWPPNGVDNIVGGDSSDASNRIQIETYHMARLPDADTIAQMHSEGMHMHVDDYAMRFDTQRLPWGNNPDDEESNRWYVDSQKYSSDVAHSGEELARNSRVVSSEYDNEQSSVNRRTDDNKSSRSNILVDAVKSGVDQFGNMLNTFGSMAGSAVGSFGNSNVQSKNQSAERRTDDVIPNSDKHQSVGSDNLNTYLGAAAGFDPIDLNYWNPLNQPITNIGPPLLNNIEPFAATMNQNTNDLLPFSNTAIDTQTIGITPQMRGNINQLIQPPGNAITFNSNDANQNTDCDPAQQNNCHSPSVMFGNTADLNIRPEAIRQPNVDIIETTTTTTQRPTQGAANANTLIMANNGNAVSEIRSGANVVRSNLIPNAANRIVVSKPLIDLGAKKALAAVPMWPMAAQATGLDKVDRLLSVSIDGKAIL